jgi:fatty acid desaturase
MSPRLRTHLVTAGLFAAVVVLLLLVWWLRSVFVYVLLGVVGLLVYWGLYLLVSSRLRERAEDAGDRRGEGEQ